MFDQLTTLLLYAYLAEVVLRIENSSIYIYTSVQPSYCFCYPTNSVTATNKTIN